MTTKIMFLGMLVWGALWTLPSFGQKAPRRVPVIFVPGYAYDLPRNDHWQFLDRMVADGFPKQDIMFVDYNYRGDPIDVIVSVNSQVEDFMSRYPSDQSFDVMGLSTGHFAAAYGILGSNVSKRIRKFVGIAGIGRGINTVNLPGIGVIGPGTLGFRRMVGELIFAISPFNNSFVQSIYLYHKAEFARWEKCALFSPEDDLITPYDSSAHPGGDNHSLPGLRHLEALENPAYYLAMKERCFAPGWPNN